MTNGSAPSTTTILRFEKNGSVIAEVKNNSLEWKVHADLTYVKVTGSISHRSFIGKDFKLVRNWQLVHLDNFANGEKNGWQGAKTIIRGCGPSKDKSLFRDCITKTNYVEKKFIGFISKASNLPFAIGLVAGLALLWSFLSGKVKLY